MCEGIGKARSNAGLVDFIGDDRVHTKDAVPALHNAARTPIEVRKVRPRSKPKSLVQQHNTIAHVAVFREEPQRTSTRYK